MDDLLTLPRCIRIPVPVSTADRALIDRYRASGLVNYVPRGVSGENDEQAAASRNWTGRRFGQSGELRHKQSLKRQLIRRLVDDGMNGREIAAETGMKQESVYCALSRLRLKIRPRDG